MSSHCDKLKTDIMSCFWLKLRQSLVVAAFLLQAPLVLAEEQAQGQEEVPVSDFMQQLMQSSGAPAEVTEESAEQDTSESSGADANEGAAVTPGESPAGVDTEQSTSDYLKQLMEASGAPTEENEAEQTEDEAEEKPTGYLRLQVAEPYIELHTGPGRGFPIYHVVDRHDWIEILKRRTEWFRVRASNGKEGWAHIANMELTLALPGRQTEFARIKHEDFMQRGYEFGVLAGDFDGAKIMTMFGGVNLTDNLAAELSISQASGKFTNSELYDVNLISTPFPRWRWTPYFTLGMGHLRNKPRETFLLAEETSDVTASAGIGIRAYLTRRFIFRANVREVIVFVDDDENGELIEWKLGFSFFY